LFRQLCFSEVIRHSVESYAFANVYDPGTIEVVHEADAVHEDKTQEYQSLEHGNFGVALIP